MIKISESVCHKATSSVGIDPSNSLRGKEFTYIDDKVSQRDYEKEMESRAEKTFLLETNEVYSQK